MAWQEHALEKNVRPVTNMGILQLEQNKISDAVALLLQAEVIAPNDSRTHEQLAKAYSRLEDFEKAQAELEKAVQLDPESSVVTIHARTDLQKTRLDGQCQN